METEQRHCSKCGNTFPAKVGTRRMYCNDCIVKRISRSPGRPRIKTQA